MLSKLTLGGLITLSTLLVATAHASQLMPNMYDWPVSVYYNKAYPIPENHTQSIRMKTILSHHCDVGPSLCKCLHDHLNQQGLYTQQAAVIVFTMQNSGCTIPSFFATQ